MTSSTTHCSSIRRSGLSLIETVACVAIVASMATSIVGLMQNSARVAASARMTSGAVAQGRQSLRELADRFQTWDQIGGITSINGRTIQSGARVYQFVKQSSQTGVGSDLILRDDLGNETTCVLGSFVDIQLNPIPGNTSPSGVEIRLRLKRTDDEAASLRPDDREADLKTAVCFPPQMRAQP
ncbi:hypothetical protein [Neorhodopirellula pilleata]|uniref:Prepilin-type N-terminal cleavage/methylation domain-containing protein n=1 Tax=Neorhodopirellula pilleata TaxID=2714738 RepID=A0A5C5ZZ17_9BACT|nr:hypothetical protein [Neorhodopirellula pilleata]TWT92277.1 hypothetical protein Pla100_48150 [Neorhodopirellula pilleata]